MSPEHFEGPQTPSEIRNIKGNRITMQKLFVCNLDRHEIFLPHQQMMWNNCVGWDSMQEIENTLSVSIRGFNREFGIFKILEGLEKQKSQGAVTSWIFLFFFFLLQNHAPSAVTIRVLHTHKLMTRE